MASNGHTNPEGVSHEDSDMSLSDPELSLEGCCGGNCAGRCGCTCIACIGRSSFIVGNASTSNYPGQGGLQAAGQPNQASRPIDIIANRVDGLEIGNSYEDQFEGDPENHSWQAPQPHGLLTHYNIGRHNEEAGDGRPDWLRHHEIEVDADPASWYLSKPHQDHSDLAGAIEGEGMEHSMMVERDHVADSRSLSQYESSFSPTSTSASALLPDLRKPSLVYRPLPLVPENHVMAGTARRLYQDHRFYGGLESL